MAVDDEPIVAAEPSEIGPAYLLLPETLFSAPLPPKPLPFNASGMPVEPCAVSPNVVGLTLDGVCNSRSAPAAT